jgi:hypothetical protein
MAKTFETVEYHITSRAVAGLIASLGLVASLAVMLFEVIQQTIWTAFLGK